jgi:hypothetical protein
MREGDINDEFELFGESSLNIAEGLRCTELRLESMTSDLNAELQLQQSAWGVGRPRHSLNLPTCIRVPGKQTKTWLEKSFTFLFQKELELQHGLPVPREIGPVVDDLSAQLLLLFTELASFCLL